ncbi:prenyltransferase/squalene oxidase repeat-containing protein [Teredinibacter waterburyi]|jgi:hypothetical protein|uniref:prenyltransferase/squalene oxidase repeat-containing protein n=1 Tax=Teredinibacter waterburyi TaxID=1500538 RepID=UPI00165EE210|nr:prenyltransferase/squalene oxidase repeat-containing protein [Teredinibacter waterburyi]
MHNSLKAKLPAWFDLEKTAQFILSCQQPDGAIRWFSEGKLDPWDHIEAVMGLSIAGHYTAAKAGLNWLVKNQNSDGSWQASYLSEDSTRIETNFVAYPATGVWHYYQVTQDQAALLEFFPMVEKAIDYVLNLQTSEGDIQWALDTSETLGKDALVTACASILRSIESALAIATTLGLHKPHWLTGYQALSDALRNKPWRFDRTWESKSRFSMDWFYPILAGIYSSEEAQLRLDKRWAFFVEEDLGCRCVSDEPWVTVAESCELILACIAAGRRPQALDIFKWLAQWQDTDGGYWTGYSFRDKVIWPQEKTSWTAGAMLLAADALFKLTPAADILTRRSRFLE